MTVSISPNLATELLRRFDPEGVVSWMRSWLDSSERDRSVMEIDLWESATEPDDTPTRSSC